MINDYMLLIYEVPECINHMVFLIRIISLCDLEACFDIYIVWYR